MSLLDDHLALLWERLERVTWDEESCFDTVLVEQLQETSDANGTREQASRDVARGVLSTVGPQPACYSIDVDGDANLDSCRESVLLDSAMAKT